MSTSITRTVSLPKKAYKKARTSGMQKPRMSIGLRRYLDVRGTPQGTYELVRTVTGSLDYTNTGFTIGAGSYEAGVMVFSPNNTYFYSGVAGNSITWSTPNASEIAALWDKIKIDKVEVTFCSSVIGAANSGTQQPQMLFAEDDNDTSASADQIKQMDCRTWVPGDQNHSFRMTVRPKFQRLVYYTALASSYEPVRGYVVAGVDIPHYALKIGLSPLGASGQVRFALRYHFKCRELK